MIGLPANSDDTLVPMLARATTEPRPAVVTYMRADRPAGDDAAPAVWFAYWPYSKREHPERHLGSFVAHCRQTPRAFKVNNCFVFILLWQPDL